MASGLQRALVEHGLTPKNTQERAMIDSDRFGTINSETQNTIQFPAGMVGFPEELEFVLVGHGRSDSVAWLQSTKTPGLAFPVVSAHGFRGVYPDVPIPMPGSADGICDEADEIAVMAVLCAPRSGPATVNLMAPIVVNVTKRIGIQVFLEGTRFSAREMFMLPRENERATEPAPPPEGAEFDFEAESAGATPAE